MEAAAAVPRASAMMEAVRRLVAAEAPRAALEDIEYLLGEVLGTLSRLESKRGRLQVQIAAASTCGRRAGHPRRAAPADGDDDALALVAPAAPAYTRKGAGAVRKRLRAAAGDVKKERERLEAVWGVLDEALVDAKALVALPPPHAGTA